MFDKVAAEKFIIEYFYTFFVFLVFFVDLSIEKVARIEYNVLSDGKFSLVSTD